MSRFWADLERVDCVANDICERYWNDPDPDVRRFILDRFAYAIEHALERWGAREPQSDPRKRSFLNPF